MRLFLIPLSHPMNPSRSQKNTSKKRTARLLSSRKTKASSLKQAVEELESTMISEALTVCRYNQRKAAAHLGLTYDQFRGKIRKYGATVQEPGVRLGEQNVTNRKHTSD